MSQGSATFNVIAGLAPLSTAGLETLNIELIPILAASYSIAFLTDPRFVANVAPVRCTASDPNCLSLVMPGGMELVRLDGGPKIAESLYTGNITGDYDTVVVHDAPAYQIEYDSLSSVDPSFVWNHDDVDGDCYMFGADIGEGIYICIHETGDKIYLGIPALCPLSLSFFLSLSLASSFVQTLMCRPFFPPQAGRFVQTSAWLLAPARPRNHGHPTSNGTRPFRSLAASRQ